MTTCGQRKYSLSMFIKSEYQDISAAAGRIYQDKSVVERIYQDISLAEWIYQDIAAAASYVQSDRHMQP